MSVNRRSVGGWLRREGVYLLVAIQFLTRLPVPHLNGFEPRWLDRSSAYFPLAGLLVGAISAAVLTAAATIWPEPVPALLAVAAGIATTGAFHEDGLADTADGLGGGHTREQRLLIMKDSRIGTYGTAALLIAFALKTACLVMISPSMAAIALLAAHAGGRVVPVVACAFLPYGGDTAGAKTAPMTPSQSRLMFACVTGFLPFLLIPAQPAVQAILVGGALAALLLAYAIRSIGGHTGDVLGAAEQVFEVGVLLVIAGTLR